MKPDLVCLGNLIVDDVVFADGTTRMAEPGGAMLYTALGAALWGVRVAIVAPVGDDYPRATLDALAARGVDLSGLRPLGRPGLRTWLLYEPAARRVVHRIGLPTHAEASPNADDLRCVQARAYHLAPCPLECQARMLDAIGDHEAYVSLDPHDPIEPASLERWRAIASRIDLLFASHEEIRLTGIDEHPRETLEPLTGHRLRSVAIKRGKRGGRHVDLEHAGRITEWPARTNSVVDPTGAGDAFAGGFLSGQLESLGLAESLARGVVSASFALEDWGAAGMLTATRDEAHRRYDAWREAFVG